MQGKVRQVPSPVEKSMLMFNPPYPGETLREDVLPALRLTVTEAADQLGVTRVALSRVLNGRAAISAEMACRIEKWLGKTRGGDASVWLSMQAAYDLWQVKQRSRELLAQVKKATVPVGA